MARGPAHAVAHLATPCRWNLAYCLEDRLGESCHVQRQVTTACQVLCLPSVNPREAVTQSMSSVSDHTIIGGVEVTGSVHLEQVVIEIIVALTILGPNKILDADSVYSIQLILGDLGIHSPVCRFLLRSTILSRNRDHAFAQVYHVAGHKCVAYDRISLLPGISDMVKLWWIRDLLPVETHDLLVE